MTIEVHHLNETDLMEADRLFRLAFGTFIGLPDPMSFAGDADFIVSRWKAWPKAAFGAYDDGKLVGTIFSARHGSFAVLGPLTVDPGIWDKGVGRKLLSVTADLYNQWGIRHAGLFTFAQSTKHVALYQKFDFWPQALTALMSKPVGGGHPLGQWTTLAVLSDVQRAQVISACRKIADANYPGLDMTSEMQTTLDLKLGEVVLAYDGDQPCGFAICHIGAGSEAGSDTIYIKFAAIMPGAKAGTNFMELLAACEAYGASRGLATLTAGINTARLPAYQIMMAQGFKTNMQGVAMIRPNGSGFNRPDCFIIDDWR